MQIIFGKENIEELKQRYTVLELEEILLPEHNGQPSRMINTYCVIPAEKIPLDELPQLENWVTLHHDFLEGYHNEQYDYCLQCIDHLIGKFGGEVDSFYEEILRRINNITK